MPIAMGLRNSGCQGDQVGGMLEAEGEELFLASAAGKEKEAVAPAEAMLAGWSKLLQRDPGMGLRMPLNPVLGRTSPA